MTEDSTKDETAVLSAGKKTAMASKIAEGSSSNEETASTEVFTRRFYILAVFSIFTMEQVQEQMSILFLSFTRSCGGQICHYYPIANHIKFYINYYLSLSVKIRYMYIVKKGLQIRRPNMTFREFIFKADPHCWVRISPKNE